MQEEGAGVEVNEMDMCPCDSPEAEKAEGAQVEALKAGADTPIPDPDGWLDEDIKRNMLLTTVDWAVDCTWYPSISTVFGVCS